MVCYQRKRSGMSCNGRDGIMAFYSCGVNEVGRWDTCIAIEIAIPQNAIHYIQRIVKIIRTLCLEYILRQNDIVVLPCSSMSLSLNKFHCLNTLRGCFPKYIVRSPSRISPIPLKAECKIHVPYLYNLHSIHPDTRVCHANKMLAP